MNEQTKPKSKRGFASMDKEKQRAIASSGGKAAHIKGTAHEWTREEARVAGRKGGSVSRKNKPYIRFGTTGSTFKPGSSDYGYKGV